MNEDALGLLKTSLTTELNKTHYKPNYNKNRPVYLPAGT